MLQFSPIKRTSRFFDMTDAQPMVERASVRVLARVRPLTAKEREKNHDPHQALKVEGNEIVVTHASAPRGPAHRPFRYDMCFCSAEGMEQRGSQEEVYAHLGPPMLECATKGLNSCLLAYGQTGSGKTHTIMGSGSAPPTPDAAGDENAGDGVLPRLLKALFLTTQREAAASTELRTVTYRVSTRYFEVYNEKVFDLLQPRTPEISIRSVKTGVLSGAREEIVTSSEDAELLLREGDRRRTVASTLKNERSSRSHAVFQLLCHKDICTVSSTSSDGGAPPTPAVVSTISCLSLVDLAGSERQKQSGAEGQQFREMVNINLSLSTLRRVIQVLHDNAVRKCATEEAKGTTSGAAPRPAPSAAGITQPPIRESVLTSILSPCFGGNSRTTMIVNVSPAIQDLADTISTLEFGGVARRVVNEVSVNEDKNQAVLREMSEEIARLRLKLDERRTSLRMSRRMSVMVRQHVEELRHEAESNRRSVGVCTAICGPVAESMLNSLGMQNVADDEGTDDDNDAGTVDLRRSILETTKMYEAIQGEAAQHVQLCHRLQQQLGRRDVLVAALRRQVQEMEQDFKEELKRISGRPPSTPSSDPPRDVVPAACDGCQQLRHAMVQESRAHETLVYHLNQNQEALYSECEHLRGAKLGTVQQLADMRNAMNVLEDKEMMMTVQASRIAHLETQCAHHMEERVVLLMENHRLRQLLAGLGHPDEASCAAANGDDVGDAPHSSSGICGNEV